MVSVRQARGLPAVSLFPHPASFRFHLAMDTLAFGCILPTTGRIRDFHPLETCAARRTLKESGSRGTALICILHYYYSVRCFVQQTALLLLSAVPLLSVLLLLSALPLLSALHLFPAHRSSEPADAIASFAAALNPCSRSQMISSMCSVPMERRIVFW